MTKDELSMVGFEIVAYSGDARSTLLSLLKEMRAGNLQQDASKYGTKVVATKGAQYIKLTRDPKGAVEFICEQVKEG